MGASHLDAAAVLLAAVFVTVPFTVHQLRKGSPVCPRCGDVMLIGEDVKIDGQHIHEDCV